MNPKFDSSPGSHPDLDTAYAHWRQQKQALEAPESLTENVMGALPAYGEGSPQRLPFQQSAWRSLIDMPWARAAVFMMAAVIGFGRYAFLLFCLIAS